MKKVFNDNNTIAHMWANQTQDYARNPQDNFYFRGRTIFSYGRHFPIAELYKENEDVVFYTVYTNSKTTAKHKSTVRGAISHKTVIRVEDPTGIELYNDQFWKAIDYLTRAINTCLHEATKPRIRETTRIKCMQEAEHDKQKAIEFLNVFGLTPATLQNKLRSVSYKYSKNGERKEVVKFGRRKGAKSDFEHTVDMFTKDHINSVPAESLKKLREKEEKEKKATERKIAKARKERAKKQKEFFELWMNGGDVSTYQFQDIGGTFLRAYEHEGGDKEVQTSKGANVPYNDAKLLYLTMARGFNIVGQEIGGYTVLENNAEYVKIGCHILLKSTIQEFAKQQNW